MDKHELVKRLKFTLDSFGVRLPLADCQAIDEAITFINTTPSRDEVLAKVAAMCILRADELNDTRSAYDAVAGVELMAMADHIRALKSAPTFTRADGISSPEPKWFERGTGADAVTSPDTRGTVEDRRKSKYGDLMGANGRRGFQRYGRRSGDRARWTGEAAPVVECGHEWGDPNSYGDRVCKKCPQVLMAEDEGDATQPAQEAPQPEKVRLVPMWRKAMLPRSATMPIDGTDMERTLDIVEHYIKRELDARQGGK